MTTNDPPPMIAAIVLSRLRDRSMGQTDEIQGLLDIMKGMEQIAGVLNETLLAIIKKKPSKSQEHQKSILQEAFTLLASGLERFIDGKTTRILQLINYLEILHQDVKDEKNQLKNFQKEWEPVNRELDILRVEFINKNAEDAMKDIDYVKNNLIQKALPIADKLTDLENKMQKKHINAIALLTTLNTSVDTNELYKLLTEEP